MGRTENAVGVIGAVLGAQLVKCVLGQLERKADSSVKKCPHCKNEFGFFRWRYSCNICGETVCSDCLTEYLLEYCPTCMIYTKNSVETFPITYHGSKYKPCTPKGEIQTNWFRSKEDALEELRIRAARIDCDVVYSVNYNKDTENQDNYVYSVWQASGIAAKKI